MLHAFSLMGLFVFGSRKRNGQVGDQGHMYVFLLFNAVSETDKSEINIICRYFLVCSYSENDRNV